MSFGKVDFIVAIPSYNLYSCLSTGLTKVLQDLRKSTFKMPYVGANGIISVPWNTKWSSDEIMRMKWRKFYDVNKKFTNLFLESFIDVLFVEEVNFKDNYTCSYKGCEGGNFFFEIFKFKKSRSPPN
mgnify:CR=1 FL=1